MDTFLALVSSCRNSINSKNWYGALATALTLPDIAGRLEQPELGSKKRYIAWFDGFLKGKYEHMVGGEMYTFMTGGDLYALRCAFLHQGESDVLEQSARAAIESFVFIEPGPISIHLTKVQGAHLLLRVDIFCEEICSACDVWYRESAMRSTEIQGRIEKMMLIHDPRDGLHVDRNGVNRNNQVATSSLRTSYAIKSAYIFRPLAGDMN